MDRSKNRDTRRHGWALVDGIRRTADKFAQHWAQLPPGAWRTWLTSMVIGWLVTSVLMLALVWLARRQIQDETALLQQVLSAIPFGFHAAIWIETPGNSVFMIPVMLAAATFAVWRGYPLRALSIVAAFALIDTVILLGWWVWDRPRPTLVLEGVAAPGFNAFPSGHVAQTISLYGLFVFWWLRASQSYVERIVAIVLLALVTGAVGLARLRLGAHWPSDIVAGAAIGLAWLTVVIIALQRAEATDAHKILSVAQQSDM